MRHYTTWASCLLPSTASILLPRIHSLYPAFVTTCLILDIREHDYATGPNCISVPPSDPVSSPLYIHDYDYTALGNTDYNQWITHLEEINYKSMITVLWLWSHFCIDQSSFLNFSYTGSQFICFFVAANSLELTRMPQIVLWYSIVAFCTRCLMLEHTNCDISLRN